MATQLFSFSLPLYCLLLSWCYTATAATAFPPASPSSATLAAQSLRNRGYSHLASLLDSLSTSGANFSGTLLAPPDFAFSFATAKFLNNRRPPPRPSVTLLLYHTLKPPLVLTWNAISSREDIAGGDELRTHYNNNCLFLFRNPLGGEVSVSSTPYKNPISAVKIRQPDLYVDDHLTVHGIDGILDPAIAVKCSSYDPVSDNVQPRVKRSFLDQATRELRRRGFSVVAAAMYVRRSELLSLTSVTILAVADRSLFLEPGGFRYDFLHHVLPTRLRLDDLETLAARGTEVDTLAANKSILVYSVNGAISADGVAVEGTEVYQNSWIAVMSVKASLDDYDDVTDQYVPSQSPSPAPLSAGKKLPSPAVDLDGGYDDYPSPTSFNPPIAPSPVDPNCDVNSTAGVEGGDLFCPARNARELTEQSPPLDSSTQSQIFENINIADDLFFYT